MEESRDEPNVDFPLPNNTSTPVVAITTSRAYRRSGHPSGRRRRSRGHTRHFDSTVTHNNPYWVQQEEDSGFEASPSSFTDSRSFTFEDMPNSIDLNGRRPTTGSASLPTTPVRQPIPSGGSSFDLDTVSDEEITRELNEHSPHSVSLAVPITGQGFRTFISPPVLNLGFINSISAMGRYAGAGSGGGGTTGHITRERGASAPPAYNVERRSVATQTENESNEPLRRPSNSLAPPTETSVRQRRASAGMAGPLPDVLPPSFHRRPRSFSTVSFPILDEHGHPLSPQQEEDPMAILGVGNRLRSLSDAFERDRRNEILLRRRLRQAIQPIEVQVAETLFSFLRYFLQPLLNQDRTDNAIVEAPEDEYQQPIPPLNQNQRDSSFQLCHIL